MQIKYVRLCTDLINVVHITSTFIFHQPFVLRKKRKPLSWSETALKKILVDNCWKAIDKFVICIASTVQFPVCNSMPVVFFFFGNDSHCTLLFPKGTE